ncbi:MAG TPA: hypothetical protein VHM91_23060 [Verrucomicrobiales bacterium]|jgi:hypothetical protein|nr:hypothetical protein [Verrucomicrobiales bacterium]
MKILLLAIPLLSVGFYIKARMRPASHGEIGGCWNIVAWPEGWKKVPGSHVDISSSEVKIVVGLLPVRTLRYELDPDEGTIDTTYESSGKTVHQLGRYHREDDTLVLCAGADGKPRPESLNDTAGGTTKWTLQLKK